MPCISISPSSWTLDNTNTHLSLPISGLHSGKSFTSITKNDLKAPNPIPIRQSHGVLSENVGRHRVYSLPHYYLPLNLSLIRSFHLFFCDFYIKIKCTHWGRRSSILGQNRHYNGSSIWPLGSASIRPLSWICLDTFHPSSSDLKFINQFNHSIDFSFALEYCHPLELCIKALWWKNEWIENIKTARQLRQILIADEDKHRTKLYSKIANIHISATQLRTGHCTLNRYLHRFGKKNSPICECGHRKETVEHHLLEWR